MGSRVTTPIELPAGVVKKRGGLQASGRYIDTEKVRFKDGKPEKIGGWTKYTSQPFKGIARAAKSWNDLSARTITAFGTTKKLYGLDVDRKLLDITPMESTATLTNAASTVNGSFDVTITHASHNKQLGQEVTLSGLDIGGIHIEGRYEITSIPTVNTYKITAANKATSTAGPTGSLTVTYDIPPGPADPAAGFGYGVAGYGEGNFGDARPTAAGGKSPFEPYYWTLDNFGKMLLAAPFQGALYQWDPTTIPVPRATPIVEAPGKMRGFFVTPERFLIAWGASPDTGPNMDPMLMRWPSQASLTDWTPSATNTANSRRLTQGKKIVGGGVLGSGVSLIWTDTAVYTHQYTGSRFVFETRLAGTSAGLAGPQAFAVAQGRAYWFGLSGFYSFSGSIERIPNQEDLREWLTDQLRQYYEPKCTCFYNQVFNEVWWLFTTGDSSENNLYVVYKIDDGSWAHGTLSRTAAYTQDGGEPRPILAGPDGYFYRHEDGYDADGAPINAWVESGSFQLQEGGVLTQALGFVPDFSDQIGEVTVQITVRDRANGKIIDRNIANVPEEAELIDLRVRGRVMHFRIQQNSLGGTFAVGKPAVEIMTGGSRR